MNNASKLSAGSRVRIIDRDGFLSPKSYVVTPHVSGMPAHTVLSDAGFKFDVPTISLILVPQGA